MIEKSIDAVLREHAARYPKMQPRDAVKLLYQANFGPGHLVKDTAFAVQMIREELLTADSSLSPETEDIGHGYTRVYLRPGISAEVLGEAFAASAKEAGGTRETLLCDIDTLRELTLEGVFRFSANELDGFVAQYKAMGMPIIRHSQEYKEAYKPAYRVVLTRLTDGIFTMK